MSSKYKVRTPDKPYFITITVVDWVDVFTRSEYKSLLIDCLKHCQQEKGLAIYGWCIMTNHLHLIVESVHNRSLADIVRDFKKYTSVMICRELEKNENELESRSWMLERFAYWGRISRKHQKYKFWQEEYHPVELYNEKLFKQKLNYIHQNPVKAGWVRQPEDYLWSSAGQYAGIKDGILEVTEVP